MTAPALLALVLATGIFGVPQASAVVAYAWGESRLEVCARSWRGEGLIGVAGPLRRDLHDFARVSGCVPAALQLRFLALRWPALYPECARRFAAGDLAAFRRCWGRGRRR